jgi:hypothetical protein
VLKHKGCDSLLVFQLDLFSAKGVLPTSLGEIAEREKDIRFARRSEINTMKNRNLYNSGQLPPPTRHGAASRMPPGAPEGDVTVIHLTYHSALPEVASRDYNFSPVVIDDIAARASATSGVWFATAARSGRRGTARPWWCTTSRPTTTIP